jgi:VWFA-related protein
MKSRRLLVSALAAVMALTAAVYAQRAAETVQVTLVEVPVTVVDRDGNAVRGLTAANFELYDDGKRVPIDYFEAVEISKASQKSEEAAPPIANRNFLLLFDLANSTPGTIGRAAEAAKEFVASQLSERDSAAVSVFTAESGARMVTNFTRDKKLLANAIETLGHPKYFKVADPLMLSATVVSTASSDSTAPGQGGRAGIDAAFAEQARELDRMQRSTADEELRNRLRIQLSNMGNVARMLDRLHGQKQVILLSEGFDARLVTGRENLSAEATRAENDAALSGQVWNVDNNQRFGSTTAGNDIRDMAELFRRSDVTLHAIDIKGLRGGTDVTSAAKSTTKSHEALFLLTNPTGGTVFKNSNDIAQTFDKVLKAQEVVYLLGFQARGTGKPGKFHPLRVKLNDAKGARVSHRTGYYEPSAQMSDLERTLTLAEILMTDAPIDDVAVNVGATTLPGPGGKARVPVVVELPGGRLLEELKGSKANANLFLYAFNEDSQVVDYLQQRISLDLDAAGDTVRKGGVRYYGTLKLAPGNYAVKALVRVEETGRIGFRRADLEVPAFDKAAIMPPVLFEDPGNWAMLFGPSRGDDFGYPFAAGEAKYIPKSEPEIIPNGDYKVALFLYRVPLENLSVVPTLVTADGASQPAKVTLLGRTSADERGSVKLLFGFKPESLAAGTHQLRFDVKAKDGSQQVVSLPFTVRAN